MTTFPPKTILVAFDFSRRSVRAWRFAKSLAKQVCARLEVIYVCPLQIIPEGAMPIPLTFERRQDLDDQIKRLLGQDVVVRIVEGDVVGGILDAARECTADLIVMATEGRTGVSRAVFGSITETVVRLSPIPILSLRERTRPLKRILAPVNLQPYSIAGFHAAEAVAKTFGAALTLLQVREPRYEDESFLRLTLAADAARSLLKIDVKTKVADGKPIDRILEEAAKQDMIVLVAHRRGIFRDGLLGTTAERVLRRSPIPVLTVPAPILAPKPKTRRSTETRRLRGRHLPPVRGRIRRQGKIGGR